MNITKMYPPQKDSPSTFLTGDIDTDDTYIFVGSPEVLPQKMPFPLTLGFDKAITETVIVTALKSNGQLTVTRGVLPYAWFAGTKCARVFTADDLTAIQNNITEVSAQVEENTESAEANAQGINDINDAIAAEVKRSKAADEAQTNAISAEINRAKSAESALDGKITSETKRAADEENKIKESVADALDAATAAYSPSNPLIIKGTCATAAATAAKVVSISGHTPTAGLVYAISYTLGNTASSPTININSAGAKAVSLGGGVPTAGSGSGAAYVAENRTVLYYYDGTYMHQLGSADITDANSTYSAITQALIDAGMSTSAYLITPKLLRDNFALKAKFFNVTFKASGWAGSGPYNQVVNGLTGLTVEMNPVADLVFSGTTATDIARRDNWQYVDRIIIGKETATALCFTDKPAVDLPIILKE